METRANERIVTREENLVSQEKKEKKENINIRVAMLVSDNDIQRKRKRNTNMCVSDVKGNDTQIDEQ